MDIERLSFVIAGSKALTGEFGRALKESQGWKVARPSHLSKVRKERGNLIDSIKTGTNNALEEIRNRAEVYGPGTLRGVDLAVQSMLIERQLAERGAVFGDKPYNFCLPSEWDKRLIEKVEKTALAGFDTLKQNTVSVELGENATASERAFEDLKFIPNCARVDIVYKDVPQIIEINSQWVDAIQALEAFQVAYLGQPRRPSPTDLLAWSFARGSRLAIINLTSATGSRSSGCAEELQTLTENLSKKGCFSHVEVVDPRKVRPAYINEFTGFYLNGEPSMITGEIPDWLQVVLEKFRQGKAQLFPLWRPSLDKKRALIEASAKNPDFAKTLSWSPENVEKIRAAYGSAVIKGDGYSSRAIALEGTELFDGLSQDAQMFPDEYVLQPNLTKEVKARPAQILAYDTSAGKPIVLEAPAAKINVWIINDIVAGILVSYSRNDIISDKDFNLVPKPILDTAR